MSRLFKVGTNSRLLTKDTAGWAAETPGTHFLGEVHGLQSTVSSQPAKLGFTYHHLLPKSQNLPSFSNIELWHSESSSEASVFSSAFQGCLSKDCVIHILIKNSQVLFLVGIEQPEDNYLILQIQFCSKNTVL